MAKNIIVPSKPMRKYVSSICRTCAKNNGGVWPNGHLATWSFDTCDNCGKVATICSVSDWNWPKGKPKNWQGNGRD